MIHTYIAHEATAATYSESKVLVSWPAWSECYDTTSTSVID
jgi:hypothetical protein